MCYYFLLHFLSLVIKMLSQCLPGRPTNELNVRVVFTKEGISQNQVSFKWGFLIDKEGTSTRFRAFGDGAKVAEKIIVHHFITMKNFKIVPQKPEFKIGRYPYQVEITSRTIISKGNSFAIPEPPIQSFTNILNAKEYQQVSIIGMLTDCIQENVNLN